MGVCSLAAAGRTPPQTPGKANIDLKIWVQSKVRGGGEFSFNR